LCEASEIRKVAEGTFARVVTHPSIYVGVRYPLQTDIDCLCSAGLPYIRLIPKVTAVAGETLKLKCPVAGYPIEDIRWERSEVQF
jgi:hypothetical protein